MDGRCAGRFLAVLFVCLVPLSAYSQARDLSASLAQIPGLADSVDKGFFVDLVKAMDEVHPGKIKIELYPFARSMNNAVTGKSDFHIPAANNPAIPAASLPYRYASEKIGTLAMVLYTNADKPLTWKLIEEAVKKGGKFPYVVEVSGGAEGNCIFPAVPTNDWEQSMKKLAAGRIDAIWNAQEETDFVLRQLKLKNVKRESAGNLDDVIVLQKSAKGDEVDVVISDLLRKLRASGKLDALYRKIHLPYDDWQPAKMGW